MSGISLSRVFVASVLVLALVLPAVPAQAQPRDPGSRLSSLDTSWFAAALGWFQGLLDGGSNSGSLQTMAAATKSRSTRPGGAVTNTGSCVDPYGNPIPNCEPDKP